jgi:hypothetical protein
MKEKIEIPSSDPTPVLGEVYFKIDIVNSLINRV